MQPPPFESLKFTAASDFPKLDANYMHREFVQDERLCPLRDTDRQTRDELADRLQSVYDAPDDTGRRLGPPPKFYALLLADGDHLGKLASAVGGKVVSKSLASFTRQVPKIILKHGGVTVYAGGDDVLAMLPVDSSLECATEISAAYRSAFLNAECRNEARLSNTDCCNEATLSAAVVCAHVRLPMRSTLAEAHRLLDDIAKTGNGRNSLAISVSKPGGLHCQWVSSWNRPHAGSDTNAVDLLAELSKTLTFGDSEPGLSSALLYRVRELLMRLCGLGHWEPGQWWTVPDGLDLRPFLGAEIRHSLTSRLSGNVDERAEALTSLIVSLLAPARNRPSGSGDGDKPTERKVGDPPTATEAGVDALLLARFLADPDDHEAQL